MGKNTTICLVFITRIGRHIRRAVEARTYAGEKTRHVGCRQELHGRISEGSSCNSTITWCHSTHFKFAVQRLGRDEGSPPNWFSNRGGHSSYDKEWSKQNGNGKTFEQVDSLAYTVWRQWWHCLNYTYILIYVLIYTYDYWLSANKRVIQEKECFFFSIFFPFVFRERTVIMVRPLHELVLRNVWWGLKWPKIYAFFNEVRDAFFKADLTVLKSTICYIRHMWMHTH